MHPVINLELLNYSLAISSYSLFTILAAVTVMGCTFTLANRQGFPRGRILLWILVTGLAVPVGARLLYLMTNPHGLDNLGGIWTLRPVGFALYGGLILAVVLGYLASRAWRLPLWPLADITAFSLGLGIMVVRIGCFLNGCCFGKITDLAWGITFPPGSQAHIYQLNHGLAKAGWFGLPFLAQPVHPTQLLEMGAGLIGAILVAYFMKSKNRRAGTGFLVFTIWFTSFRWGNSYLRVASSQNVTPPYFYPLLYIAIILLCIALLVFINQSHTNKPSMVEEED